MFNRLFFLFLITFFSFAYQAQELNDSLNKNRVVYTFDLFRAFQGSMQVNREVYITPNRTFVIGLIGTYASTKGIAKPYLNAQSFEYTNYDLNKTYNLEDVQALGLGINLKSKKYLNSNFEGFYVTPELFYRHLSLQSLVFDASLVKEIEVKRELDLAYFGYALGYQKIWKKVVAIDSYLGGGFFYSKYSDEKNVVKYRNPYQIDYTGFYFNAGILIGIAK
jgi:hypothetical protein